MTTATKKKRRPAAPPDTRARLFAAAATEFAARGFAGANVDRIADAARVNKAMLYYHFASKANLYGEVLRDMFGAVAARLEASVAPDAPPAERVRAVAEAIGREAEIRPHFPPIWLREVADGGVHIDKATLQVIAGLLGHVHRAVGDGIAAGQFRPANALLVQFGIVGPLLLFFATAAIRKKVGGALGPVVDLTTDDVIAHVQRVALQTLEGKPR
jgi:TetR/AcrR family transcriptional regulator